MKQRILVSLMSLFVLGTTVLTAAPAPTREQQRFEKQFLMMMIDHHFGAVKMAELCNGRPLHPELQAMCDSIETTQTTEIAQLQSWLQAWYGVNHAPMLDRRTRRQVEELSRLTGAEFERAFMQVMIRHHSMAITMGNEALLRAYHPELINMAAMMIGSQADEIAQMRLWLAQWYQVTQLSHHRRD